ncbi:MAG: FHA domain-containing protein, partial [Myxococcota bacterium]
MNYLVVHYPEGTERAFSLESGELSVGRDSGCDVVLASQAVSRRHARIYTWKDQVFVEDLGSESGILVSGRRVGKAAMIPPGVPIVIDTFRLVVEDREDASQAPGGWGVLKGRTAPVKRQTFILEIPEYYVGRAEENDLVLAHQSISRRHAVLRYNNGVPQVTDLDSSTGVFIGGKRVKEAALTEGAVLKFGDIEFSYGAPAKRASRPAAAGSGRRPVFIMLAVFVALAMVVAAIALKRHAAQQRLIEQRSQEAAKLKSDSDFVLDRIDRAAAHIQKDQFEEALADDGDALDRDPLNTEALNLRKKALSEIASRKVFEEAETSYALGRFDEALKGYNMVPSDSAYNV